MVLEIIGVEAIGELKHERLVINVNTDGNISRVAAIKSTINPNGSLSRDWQHTFSFPSLEVKKGDQVILYTRKGDGVSVPHEQYNNHYFFWNCKKSIWNDPHNVHAVLMEVMEHKKIGPLA